AARYGFAVQHLAVQPPGLDQKETWRRVKAAQPDWVILRSAGIMTSTALKEAAQVGFPRDKIEAALLDQAGRPRQLRGPAELAFDLADELPQLGRRRFHLLTLDTDERCLMLPIGEKDLERAVGEQRHAHHRHEQGHILDE